jgi:hypothetical protein
LEGNEYANDTTFSISNNDSRLAQGHALSHSIANGSNQTISNWYRLADNYQAMPSRAEDAQAFDIQAGMNALRVYEGENAYDTTSSNEMLNEGRSAVSGTTTRSQSINSMSSILNEGLSAASRTTTRSQSINSVSSTYSSLVSDESGPSSRPLTRLNDSVTPTGFALQSSQQEYNTGMLDDVGFDFSPLLSQSLICEVGESFPMGSRGLAE